jgi:hypothetical protein
MWLEMTKTLAPCKLGPNLGLIKVCWGENKLSSVKSQHDIVPDSLNLVGFRWKHTKSNKS